MELEGVEPSSAQGNHALSTCLFQTRFSCADKTWTTGPTPYPLKLHRRFGASRRLFPNNLRRLTLGFGTTPLERRLVRLPCKRIKLVIYCTSIKQREHTRCCQLIFRPKRLWSLQPPSSACLHTISSCRQIQSTPLFMLLPWLSVRFVVLRCKDSNFFPFGNGFIKKKAYLCNNFPTKELLKINYCK